MTKIIGLTGGIGSGKTTVARYIAQKGIPVYVSDSEAKKIAELPETVSEIIQFFGKEILNTEGQIDRKKLGNIVFNDSEKLEKLNQIIHPKVKQHFSDWLQEHKEQPFVVKEVAILFETGGHKDCDYVILVTAPTELRVERTMARDGLTRQQVLDRIQNQMSDEDKAKMSDFVIQNIELQDTLKKIDNIFLKIRKS
ncbi:dephospho-CoA kinase [Flavobacterium sediminis]|uniref:Dephospho-CoA kinase n=1 Tax=Flavobacterium sediminis TaxID=2201181 RepID=A0A2U8QYP0_9FLAO|nr:dephospho-CoA kinase [Flavobacterium sediminis]AWM15340.1 dephospho-CoA kinase [Flavobacterium sediminis]